jgi:hypothetical protein
MILAELVAGDAVFVDANTLTYGFTTRPRNMIIPVCTS